MIERLPFTYTVKGKYWRFRHRAIGDVAIDGEPFSEPFLDEYRKLLSRAGAAPNGTKIERIIGLNIATLKTGTVYFIGWDGGPIKIGVAVDVPGRLRVLQCACPYPLVVLAESPGGAPKEKRYHRKFAAHRLEGEWFQRHPDLVAEIERLKEAE